jgi:hypothetical protein
MKQYLAFIFLILCTTSVLADPIQSTTVHVKIYNTTLEFSNPDYSGNNKNISLTINDSMINLQDLDFPILFIKNETVDKSTVDKYADCIAAKGACETEKAQFNMAWNGCKIDLSTCQSNNNQSVKDSLNSCELDRQKVQLDLESKSKDLTDCTDEQKTTGNSKFVWAIGGALIGFVATMFITGKWGSQNKDKSQEEFNAQRGY